IKMKDPGSQHSAYSGKLNVDQFQVGQLFDLDYIGSLTGEAFIEGKGFDPQTALVNIDARLSQFQMNGYHYKNIVANGNLARRQFIGDINIKDPNLTAVFDGFLDFRDKNLIITAKSDIAHADVQQLKLFNQNVKLSG